MAVTTLADELVGRTVAFQEIPVVDVGPLIDGSDPAGVAAELGRAAAAVGFVYVRNNGVPAALRAAMMAEMERFFAEPLDAKNAIHIRNSAVHRGYFPLFEENTDPDLTADFKEGLDLGRDLGPEAPEVVQGLPLHGPNQWPEGLPDFRETTEAYFGAMRSLAETLMRGFALALDLAPDFFADKIDRPCASLRLLHYPPQEGHVEARTMGCGAHTDYGCLTILAQDDNGGLQVRNAAGEWIAAPPIPGTFVINLGDQMARWTNGRFQATPHRVINKSDRLDRYSIAMFFDPCLDSVIETIPRFADLQPGRYEPIRYCDYFTLRLDTNYPDRVGVAAA